MLPDPATIQKAVATLTIVHKNALNRIESPTHDTIHARDEVLARYQPIFNSEAVGTISEEDFRSFLIAKNNKHWNGLQRLGPRMTEDMPKLREALTILVDETRPLQKRLDTILPKSGPKVNKLGRAVVTAILLIVFPDKYGPMNNTSVEGAEKLGLMPRFTGNETFGERYILFNEMLLTISRQLGVDLWTLDALWYEYLGMEGEQDAGEGHIEENETEITPQARFGLEKYLQEFIRDNWEHIRDLKDWNLLEEDGEVIGFEYDTHEIGRIDLLARHKKEDQWLVIELKRNQTSDATIGQTLRYMGWVDKNLAKGTQKVKGMIICHEGDSRIKYALSYTNNVDLLLYEVEFRLRKE
jgi:hypothetical protein